MNMLKYRGGYIKDVDLAHLNKKLNINESFKAQMQLKFKSEPPYKKKIENWYE